MRDSAIGCDGERHTHAMEGRLEGIHVFVKLPNSYLSSLSTLKKDHEGGGLTQFLKGTLSVDRLLILILLESGRVFGVDIVGYVKNIVLLVEA